MLSLRTKEQSSSCAPLAVSFVRSSPNWTDFSILLFQARPALVPSVQCGDRQEREDGRPQHMLRPFQLPSEDVELLVDHDQAGNRGRPVHSGPRVMDEY